jgi:hypothetical protein
MPMDFPDAKSLIEAADCHKFRQPKEDETIGQFRTALADHVRNIDFIESEEIRNGKGWDKFSESENIAMLKRSGAGSLIR